MPNQRKAPKTAKCPHPFPRHYAGNYFEPVLKNGEWVMEPRVWFGCCECGQILTYDLVGDKKNRAKPKKGKGGA